MNAWLCLITSLPTENATARMRAWRTLKASGAAVLRDGVYLLPAQAACRSLLTSVAEDVAGHGGSAWVLPVEEPEGAGFSALFDRSAEYAPLLEEIEALRARLAQLAAAGEPAAATELPKALRRLRKRWQTLEAVDFFPGEAQRQAAHALDRLEQACIRVLSPDEPQPLDVLLEALDPQDYQGRIWATRQRPGVDRLASAWLIRRFIDPQARLLWLADPGALPAGALGFDFDGARFSHTLHRVTFEVLAASFGLCPPGLERLGRLVHSLDVGGARPPEAAGIEGVLAGLRASLTDDDQLCQAAGAVFDGLLIHFSTPAEP